MGTGGDELFGGMPSRLLGALPAVARLGWTRRRLRISLPWLLPRAQVALDEAPHGFVDGVLGKAAHLADERAQPFDVFVEGLERMSANLLHIRCSDQPNRPVI